MLKEYWNKKFSKNDYFGTGPTNFGKEFVDFAKKYNIKKVLDLGCGQGRDSLFFKNNKLDVIGVDLSGFAINKLKEAYTEIEWHETDIKDLSLFSNESFDAVYSNLVFQFLIPKDLKKVFAEVYRVLKSSGFFYFSVKNPKDKNFGLGTEIEKGTFNNNGIARHFYNREDIKEIFKGLFNLIKFEEGSHFQTEKPSVYWKVIARRI